jgi:hypothetical protein
MAIGPVQLIVLGFDHPDFHGEIFQELERLRESDTVRVIDALAIHKNADGEIEVSHVSGQNGEAGVLGSKVGALVGLGGGSLEPAVKRQHAFSEEDAWDVIEDIPPDTAAALLLIDHHWAIPLRDAVMRSNGFRIADGFINPLDLVAIGLLTAEEADEQLAFSR